MLLPVPDDEIDFSDSSTLRKSIPPRICDNKSPPIGPDGAGGFDETPFAAGGGGAAGAGSEEACELSANKAVSQSFVHATDDEKDGKLYNLLCEWVTDCHGKPVTRFENFDLYKMIARRMKCTAPLYQLRQPHFAGFRVRKATYQAAPADARYHLTPRRAPARVSALAARAGWSSGGLAWGDCRSLRGGGGAGLEST